MIIRPLVVADPDSKLICSGVVIYISSEKECKNKWKKRLEKEGMKWQLAQFFVIGPTGGALWTTFGTMKNHPAKVKMVPSSGENTKQCSFDLQVK